MPKTFTLISLGSRGVGKTVFLACNCAEILRSGQRKNNAQKLWFECLDQEFQDKIESLVGYVVRTGQYPPPTFKITDFGFSLRGKSLNGNKTLCHFRWLDLPGEWCDIENSEFQSVLLQSHGCCVFIDAHALLHEESYLETIEAMVNQVEAIASLVNQHHLKYPFALICTKCDLVDLSPIGLIQLEEKLIPLLQRLGASNAHYRRFYSAIPIVNQSNGGILKVKDATAPLLWLIAELQRLHGSDAQFNLGNSLNQMISNSTHGSTKPPVAQSGSADSAKPVLSWPSFRSQKAVLLILLGCGVLSVIAALSLQWNVLHPKTADLTPKQRLQKYESVLKKDPSNREAMTQVIDAYTDLGQYDQAILTLETILKTSPRNIDVLFELAGLFALTGQSTKEENIYDQILNQQGNNIFALTSKASLRKKKGDLKTAKELFEKAEKIAPTESLKSTINKMSKEKPKP
jgi:tetratricopeptide (TPR) repeat protein